LLDSFPAVGNHAGHGNAALEERICMIELHYGIGYAGIMRRCCAYPSASIRETAFPNAPSEVCACFDERYLCTTSCPMSARNMLPFLGPGKALRIAAPVSVNLAERSGSGALYIRIIVLVAGKPGLLYVRHFERRGTALLSKFAGSISNASLRKANTRHTVWKRAE
jgi:hypothetical protein